MSRLRAAAASVGRMLGRAVGMPERGGQPADARLVAARARLAMAKAELAETEERGVPLRIRTLARCVAGGDAVGSAAFLHGLPPERLPASVAYPAIDVPPHFAWADLPPDADPRALLLAAIWRDGRIPDHMPDPGPHRAWFEAFAAAHAAEPWSLRLLAALAV